jgi:general secretion pathway protein A
MYERRFGLKQRPFSIAPDPRYLFMSGRYREALAHLLYAVDRRKSARIRRSVTRGDRS